MRQEGQKKGWVNEGNENPHVDLMYNKKHKNAEKKVPECEIHSCDTKKKITLGKLCTSVKNK